MMSPIHGKPVQMARTGSASHPWLGNGYTRVKRNRRGGHIHSCCMPWETTLMNTGIDTPTYGLYNEYGAFAIGPDDMITSRALGNNQKMGLVRLQHAETIGMGMSGRNTESFFSGNAVGGIVSVKSGLNKSWGWLKNSGRGIAGVTPPEKKKPCCCQPIWITKAAVSVS